MIFWYLRIDYEDQFYTTASFYEDTELPQDEDVKFLDMYNNIYSIRQDLERVKRPTGTRDNPSRSCRDLYYGHPQYMSGNYFSKG